MPAEGGFICGDSRDVAGLCLFHGQLARNGTLSACKLLEQFRTDRQQVAACQRQDLIGAAETGTHDLGRVAELLVIVIDLAHGTHAGIVFAAVRHGVPFLASLLLVPIENAAHERGDQLRAGLGTSHCLRQREQQRHVAADVLALQDLGSADAFPCRGDLDQHALACHATLLVQADQVARLGNGGLGIERQTGVDLGRHAAGHDGQDLAAECDQELVHDAIEPRIAVVITHGLFQQRAVFRLLYRLENQRRIGSRVLWLVLLHQLEVAGVGHYRGELPQLFKLVHDWVPSEGEAIVTAWRVA